MMKKLFQSSSRLFQCCLTSLELPPLVVSSDLNGTLVFEHTMSDMILKYLDESDYRIAKSYFDQQTSGLASMEEAFGKAGPLTKGLTLRNTIEYTVDYMTFVPGFDTFIKELSRNDIPLVINSTGYSVTIEAIRQRKGSDFIHGSIGNRLLFVREDMEESTILDEFELGELIRNYFHSPLGEHSLELYENVVTNGEIELGIIDESAKASLILEYCKDHRLCEDPSKIVHIGDTMGDSMGILNIAKMGGTGIAFNYNEELRNFLEKEIEKDLELEERIHFVDERGGNHIDIRNTLPFFLG